MKPSKFLMFIINISFWLLSVRFIASVVIYFYVVLGGRVQFKFLKIGEDLIVTESFITTVLLFTFQLLISAIFLYAVFLIKKIITNLNEAELYTRVQISGLNLMGQLIILVTVLNSALAFLKGIANQKIGIEISFDKGFGSFLLVIAIGLFFIYLSKVFENSRRLKEENDLTV